MDRSYVHCMLIYRGCLLLKNSFVNISEVNRQCLHSLGTRSEDDFEKVSIFIKNAKTLNTWRHVKVRVARDRNSCVVAIPSPPRPKRPVGLKLQIGWPHLAYFDLRGVRGQRSKLHCEKWEQDALINQDLIIRHIMSFRKAKMCEDENELIPNDTEDHIHVYLWAAWC